MKIIYKLLQRRKEQRVNDIGIPLPSGIRKLEKRKYLTVSSLKNWNELTLKDKLDLNIRI